MQANGIPLGIASNGDETILSNRELLPIDFEPADRIACDVHGVLLVLFNISIYLRHRAAKISDGTDFDLCAMIKNGTSTGDVQSLIH